MLRLMRKLAVPLLFVLTMLLLAGCQQVADVRAEFCQNLRNVGPQVTEFKSARFDQPVDQFRTKVDALQQKRRNLDRLARLTSIPAIVNLDAAVDNIAQVVGQVTGDTLGLAASQISAVADKLQQAYAELNDAVCAAK